MRKILTIILASLLLSSCTVLENSINKRVVMTLTALPSGTPYPTNTPYATYTAYPSITPTPTLLPAAAFVKWNVDQTVQAFLAANLPVGQFRAMTKEDYGAAPQMALQGVCIFTSSNAEACDGRVLSFLDQQSLDKTRQYYADANDGWVYVNTNILVQISPSISEERAKQYEAVLNGLK